MNEIDRIIFQFKVEAREAFTRLKAAQEKLEQLDVQARRVGMKVDYDSMELIPVLEQKEAIVKPIKKAANGEINN
jgi:archaellum component FlaC